MNTYSLFKTIAFRFDPELVHDFSMDLLSKKPWLANFFKFDLDSTLEVHMRNLTWMSPVGLAAGLDKNAVAYEFFSQLPFGAVEVGTVTPKSQSGNKKPRLFRYEEEASLRNCMGFNNEGSNAMKGRLRGIERTTPLGINLGKNKLTPDDKVIDDYTSLYKSMKGLCDYLVINVSSPNTPGLRQWQNKSFLKTLLQEINELRSGDTVPLFLKISPDTDRKAISDTVELAEDYGLTGIIATNTTASMPHLGEGGVSGLLLRDLARKVRKDLLEISKGSNLEVIGVGGISSFEDVWEFWRQGGKCVQVYTGLIYQGPQLLIDILKETKRILAINELKNMDELYSNINSVVR